MSETDSGSSSELAACCKRVAELEERLRLATDALNLREERLDLSQKAAKMGMFEWSYSLRVNTWSKGIEALYGLPPDSRELDGDGWKKYVHPDDLARLDRELVPALYRGGYVGEFRVLWPDGSTHWLQARVKSFFKAPGEFIRVVGIDIDVTDLKRAESSLRQSEEEFRAMFELAYAGKTQLDPVTGRYLRVNKKFCELTGYTAEELTAMTFWQITHPDDRERDLAAQEAASGHQDNWSVEKRYIRKDGSAIWVHVMATVIRDETGKPKQSFAVVQDLTDRKRAEDERLELEAQVQQAQKLESLGVLAGGIAHDFNNLLMVILGNLDLARSDLPSSSPSRETLQEAISAGHRAADLCNQLLAYSGKGRFVITTFSLNDVIKDIAHMLRVFISKKAELNCVYADGLPGVMGDATQMRQVITNLVINASEALGDSAGVITLRTRVVDCDKAVFSQGYAGAPLTLGRYVAIEVDDTGCGMAPETIEKIFEPFFTTKFTGRGLGLAAVLGIVRSHRGAIRIQSELGLGTRVQVLLPIADAPAQTVESPPEPDDAWRGEGTVLLVDDEEAVLAVGRKMLERAGFDVLTAANGRDAVQLFSRHAGRIACVLLDRTMPHMGGDETFRELRRIRPDVSVLMCSGYSEQEIEQHFAAGARPAAFIQKPYDQASLTAKLKEVLTPCAVKRASR